MTAQAVDINGYVEVKGNPISKIGVYPYLGSEIGAPEPERVYNVYRPEEELSDPETIASFRLMPFIDEHTMLGSEDEGLTPAERKGVQGVIGEDVFYDAPYLRGNLKLYSEAAKGLISTKTKYELSPGYRCTYDFTPGVFDGQEYDAIQRNIRANHLALVEEGRTGPDVAVLDHARMLCALDSNQLKEAVMADETPKAVDGLEELKRALRELSPDELKSLLEEMAPKSEEAAAAVEEAAAEVAAEEMADESTTEEAADEEPAKDEDTGKAMDAMRKEIAGLKKRLNTAQDSVINSIADRDALAGKVSNFVGTFDHSRMSAKQVAEYGVKKLGIKCQPGAEHIALDAWMQGRTPAHHKQTFAADSASAGVNLTKLWEQK